jgi:hypothetical protein
LGLGVNAGCSGSNIIFSGRFSVIIHNVNKIRNGFSGEPNGCEKPSKDWNWDDKPNIAQEVTRLPDPVKLKMSLCGTIYFTVLMPDRICG